MQMNELKIIPRIHGKVTAKEGYTTLPETICIQDDELEQWSVKAFQIRTERIVKRKEGSICIFKNRKLRNEAYQLVVSENDIQIEASAESGVINALTTLFELCDAEGKALICEIADQPIYQHRGLSLDCARHFWSIDTIKNIIEQISLAKMNVLHWHLTDDQGWRIESKKFPLLQKVSREYYTQDEIRDIVHFAKIRNVEIIPEIDLPGHVTGILAAYPKLSCSEREVSLAVGGGIFKTILCAGKNQTFDFLEELLEEICSLFSSERIHIGGDEAPKTEWKICPHCRKIMEQEQLSNLNDVQGYFSARITQILKKYGKKAICWNDSLLAKNFPADTCIQYWSVQYAAQMQNFVRQGGSYIYSDMFELYLDYPYSMTPMKKIYQLSPHISNLSCGKENGMLGMEACIWSEHIKSAKWLLELIFPRIFALAEICWSGKGDYEEFKKRIAGKTTVLEQQNIAHTDFDWWDPQGDARREEAIRYFTSIGDDMDPSVKGETMDSAGTGVEFQRCFMTRFFQPEDAAFLAKFAEKK